MTSWIQNLPRVVLIGIRAGGHGDPKFSGHVAVIEILDPKYHAVPERHG